MVISGVFMSENAGVQDTIETSSEVKSEPSKEAQAGAVNEAKEVLADPNASSAEKKAAEKRIKEFEIKAYGKAQKLSLDLDNDDEIKKYLTKAASFDKASQEAAEIRKAATEFIEELRKNPRKILSDPNIGLDLKEFAQQIINEHMEEEAKSPEQREIEKLRAELEARMEADKKAKEDFEKAEFTRLQQEAETRLESDIESALTSSDLPKSPYTVKKMADIMLTALQNGIELSPKDVVPLLRQQMAQEIKEMFSASSEDVLEELLGNDNLTRLQKRRMAKAKAVQTANSVKPSGNEPVKKTSEDKKINMKDFFKL
jgi:predicted house-cleaning NTP pyrophosphatase (Maf/HAM1 superfamily)